MGIVKDLYDIVGPPTIAWLKNLSRTEKVLVLGSGGVGKTTMAEILAEGMSLLQLRPEYEESVDMDVFAVKVGRQKIEVHVAAGQKHRRDATWQEVLKMVREGQIGGVILVNAFGYHSIGPLGLAGQATYRRLKADGRETDFLQVHLEEMRADELVVLDYLAPHLKEVSRKKLWMVSAITKEDLWHDSHDTVRNYYQSGHYDAKICEIRDTVGAMAFHHEYLTMSLIIQDFVTGRGERLASSSRNYDQAKQVASAKRFFSTLSSLC